MMFQKMSTINGFALTILTKGSQCPMKPCKTCRVSLLPRALKKVTNS